MPREYRPFVFEAVLGNRFVLLAVDTLPALVALKRYKVTSLDVNKTGMV